MYSYILEILIKSYVFVSLFFFRIITTKFPLFYLSKKKKKKNPVFPIVRMTLYTVKLRFMYTWKCICFMCHHVKLLLFNVSFNLL
jgi:hypothetical protein